MNLKEKYTNNDSHFAIRSLTFLAIVALFVLHSVLFINPHGRSCLGPPSFLPFVFIGFPLIFVGAILDILILAFLRKLNWEKFIINISFLVLIVLFFMAIF
jgi:hypothetical protein